mgnify:FL=1
MNEPLHNQIPLDEALQIVDDTVAPLTGSELVSVTDALGRRAAADQTSRLDLPPFNKSAMDGFAVLSGDDRECYRLLETVPAGSVARSALTPGTTIKVMTGAPVPEGAGRVIIQELAEEADGVVRVRSHDCSPNICLKGEDVRVGDTVLHAGTMIGPVEIANLVACGIDRLEAARRVRVYVISTGDEIVSRPGDLAPGKIMNSNGPMLAALASEAGMEVISEEAVPDDRAATAAAIRRGVEAADMVVLSGGVSAGEFDFVIGALGDAGLQVRFARLLVQPGKPTVYAASLGKYAFALSGNPVSVFLMWHVFVLRAAAAMQGGRSERRAVRLPLAADYRRRRADRLAFVPAKLTEAGTVEVIEYHGSAHLAALMQADGFVAIPIRVVELRAGEEVRFMPIARFARW